MHIIAIGWLFCALMLAIGASSVLAGVLIFVFWGIAPLALIFWMSGSRARRARQLQEDKSIRPTNPEHTGAADPSQPD